MNSHHLTETEKSVLKKAFRGDLVSVLEKVPGDVRTEITDIGPLHSRKRKGNKSPSKRRSQDRRQKS